MITGAYRPWAFSYAEGLCGSGMFFITKTEGGKKDASKG